MRLTEMQLDAVRDEVSIFLGDDATEQEIYDIAWDKYGESDINYGKCDMDITDIEKI